MTRHASALLIAVLMSCSVLPGAEPPRELRLHAIYVTNQDRPPRPDHQGRLHRIMVDVQAFYRDEMERNEYGPMTFPLDQDEKGRVRTHLVKLPWDFDPKTPFRTRRMTPEIAKVLKADGLDADRTYYIVFQNGYWLDGKTWRYDIPYTGSGDSRRGKTWAADHEWLDPKNFLAKGTERMDDRGQKLTRPQFNTKMIGGVAHELGHGLGLPHNREEPDELRRLGNALMGAGNYTYRRELHSKRKGAFLTQAHAFALSLHPLFKHERAEDLTVPACGLEDLRFEHVLGKLLVSGRVSPAKGVAGMVFYHDKLPTGVNKDYDAWPYHAPVDAEGRFVQAVDLPGAGEYALHVIAYFRNGMKRKWSFTHEITGEMKPGLAALRRDGLWGELIAAWDRKDTALVQQHATKVTAQWPERKEQVARFVALAKAWGGFPLPALVPEATKQISLSGTRWQAASVAWYIPSFDGILTPDASSYEPLQSTAKVHSHGLYAHAEASYAYELGGKWKTFAAQVGLQKGHAGSVVFVVVGDGKELARTPLLKLADGEREIKADVTGINQLELKAESGPDGRSNDWAIWFSPTLGR